MMSKYLIHACPKRMWYVNEYLVPSLIQQGINDEDINIKCDKFNLGNLAKCMEIFESMNDDGGTWHIQDDVIVCRDFKKRTEECEKYNNWVVCGFSWRKDENVDMVGYVPPQNMWWSFPCIYIPNQLARECALWFYRVKDNPKYVLWTASRQYDDYFFYEFLKTTYAENMVLNLSPNLVDHIDYLLGGTTLKIIKKDTIIKSSSFIDMDLVDELETKISGKYHNLLKI